MTNTGITIALILAFIAIVWMTWKELRKDLIREDHQNCPEQSTEYTRAVLINVWKGLDV